MGIKILGAGKYIPPLTVSNEDLSKMVETSDEWITSRTGIKTRHYTVDEPTYVLGKKAALGAIADAGITPSEIDMVIATTVTPDYLTPSTACMIANEIGAFSAVSFDINAACAGFVFALDIAHKYLASPGVNKVLIVSCEALTKMVDFNDRSTCVLFGDGAGACVVGKSEGFFESAMTTDASGVSKLFAKAVTINNPFMKEAYDKEPEGFPKTEKNYLSMDGREVYKFATKAMPNAVSEACRKAGITPDELSLIIPHQANIRIVQTAAKNLGISMDKLFVNIEKYGNISSACIPVAISEAKASGRIKKGDKLCLVGFGAGLVSAAAVFEF